MAGGEQREKSMVAFEDPSAPYAGLREIVRMAGPVIFGTLSFTIMQFADNVMVGKLPGDAALAAAGSAGIWVFVVGSFFMGMLGCVATFVSQSLGRGDRANCAHYAWQGIYLAFVAGAATVVLWPFADAIFGVMGHEAEVARLEALYFRIRIVSYVFIGWQVVLTCFFQSINHPRIPMYASFIANGLNVVLDYGMIFGKLGFPRMELAGAAWATVIALAVQAVLMQAVFMHRRFDREYATRTAWRLDWAKIRELVRIGWAGGFMFMMDVLNWAIFTSVMIGRWGDKNQMAAHAAAMAIMHTSFMPVVGLSHAITPIVGQWIGRGRIDLAKARTFTSLWMGVPFMAVMGVIMAVFAQPVIYRLFSTNPEVIAVGQSLLIFAAVFQGFDAVNIVMIGALRGTGDTKWMMWAFIILGYVFFLPFGLLTAKWFETAAVGAWFAATVYISALSMVLFYRFTSEGWRSVRIFDADPPEAASRA